jgi:hypothetical protein
MAVLVGVGVFIGMSFSGSDGDPSEARVPMELKAHEEVLLVDPTTRKHAREALRRWGRVAPDTATRKAVKPSLATQKVMRHADALAGEGNTAAAAAALEQARAKATTDGEKSALGFQQILILNTAGRTKEARKVAEKIGRDAKDFATQRAAMGTLQGLEENTGAAP